MDVGDLSNDKANDVAYLDATKEAILLGFNAVLVDAGRRYRIKIGDTLVGVVSRRKEREWASDEMSRAGVDAMAGVDYSRGVPEFHVVRCDEAGTQQFGPHTRDRWELLRPASA
jgi:hypothetical protein